ncbi:hypothetical protein ACP6EK_03940 [Candidatus Caldatribacterium sp. SIUC1]|uniref:hypothetical protein n=1 Tax=Candidatus Caldatribacterium sp. SIUC1 TaxID=3418365 RepID=UPI003F68CA9B
MPSIVEISPVQGAAKRISHFPGDCNRCSSIAQEVIHLLDPVLGIHLSGSASGNDKDPSPGLHETPDENSQSLPLD